jgi:hypothetical protein
MKFRSHSQIQKHANPQFFFSTEKRRRIEVSHRSITTIRVFCDAAAILIPYRRRQSSQQRTCLRTDAEPSITARESYTRVKKEESSDLRHRSEREKYDAKTIVAQTAERTHKPIRTPYLAINWQRGNINAQLTWQDQRFPTPPHPQNSTEIELVVDASVTTSHVFRPNERRKRGFLLPIWQRNPDFLGNNCNGRPKGAGGVRRRQSPKFPYR